MSRVLANVKGEGVDVRDGEPLGIGGQVVLANGQIGEGELTHAAGNDRFRDLRVHVGGGDGGPGNDGAAWIRHRSDNRTDGLRPKGRRSAERKNDEARDD